MEKKRWQRWQRWEEGFINKLAQLEAALQAARDLPLSRGRAERIEKEEASLEVCRFQEGSERWRIGRHVRRGRGTLDWSWRSYAQADSKYVTGRPTSLIKPQRDKIVSHARARRWIARVWSEEFKEIMQTLSHTLASPGLKSCTAPRALLGMCVVLWRGKQLPAHRSA